MRSPVDPIPVREERERLKLHAETVGLGIAGADALEWFAEYGATASDIQVTATAVASSTPHAEAANRYVRAAAAQFSQAILDSAVAAAKRDFDAAVNARKPKS